MHIGLINTYLNFEYYKIGYTIFKKHILAFKLAKYNSDLPSIHLHESVSNDLYNPNQYPLHKICHLHWMQQANEHQTTDNNFHHQSSSFVSQQLHNIWWYQHVLFSTD
ncbi:hypothetical protein BpHYR1_047298 [Brachionus plicatilis]|uniref:Uncharacterized protein n=1 Tax=Brachionus plicatilis TaxID=10195 RepID=A0A3M7T0P2_BRAPC|nr:hypothetical protein BpHYR1_047298 [Brachionus plicatilis]